MSEYQYYEFRAVDRPLHERALRTLRSLSTRAEITPTSFVNTYNWRDFKGDPDVLMEECFDAFVYVANWGTRRFVLRLPGKPLSRELLSYYSGSESLRARKAGEFIIIDFSRQEDGGEWIRALPEKDKDALLVDAALNAASVMTGAEILRRFDLSQVNTPPSEAQAKRRTVGGLLAAAREIGSQKARLAAERAKTERLRQEQEAAKARARYLDELARREQATWQKIEMLIETKQAKKYDMAVTLLVDLRDLAARSKADAEFQAALVALRKCHAAKPSFLGRLLDAGL